MRFDAVPTVGVNEVKFGMNREKVRSLLGAATEFYKFDDDINTTDDFGFCHVFYDENNECEAIEIFDEEAIGDFEQDDEGLISISKSIGIYGPDGHMESILFAKEDYYNDEA